MHAVQGSNVREGSAVLPQSPFLREIRTHYMFLSQRLWTTSYDEPGVPPMSFLKVSVVIAIVWAAIGATMAFFIVMVLRKNDSLDHNS